MSTSPASKKTSLSPSSPSSPKKSTKKNNNNNNNNKNNNNNDDDDDDDDEIRRQVKKIEISPLKHNGCNPIEPVKTFTELILDVALASSLPVRPIVDHETHFDIQAVSSTNHLADRAAALHKRERRELAYTIGPLLTLMTNDIDNPIALKATLCILILMESRICMTEFMNLDGLIIIGRMLDTLIIGRNTNLKEASMHRDLVLNLCLIYREVGVFYSWPIVRVGAIRHAIAILRFGDLEMGSVGSAILTGLSTDLQICKLMFSNGAIKPLLNCADPDTGSNDPCILASLGAIIQFCRIPPIAIKLVKQGAVPVIEKALHRDTGRAIGAIREKALLSLAWLSRIKEVRNLITTARTLAGMKREIETGTMSARLTVVQMMLNLHNGYDQELEFSRSVIDSIIYLLTAGPWNARNLVVKTVSVIYKEPEDKHYLVEHHLFEAIFALMTSKAMDLQEAPMVALLSLLVVFDIPWIFIEKGGLKVIGRFMYAEDPVIRELAIIILKSMALYNAKAVEEVIPIEKRHLMDKDDDFILVGSEYGEMIEEYLQRVVENRKDMHYLLEQFEGDEIEQLNLPAKELESYENTFMELDFDCGGTLSMDELKVLMVMLGEKMDKEELEIILKEYDEDGSGSLDFKEFVVMMRGWSTRFGSGATKVYNEMTKRGAIGKATRHFSAWWNRDATDKAEIEELKRKKKKEAEERQNLAEQFWEPDKLEKQRKQEEALRREEKQQMSRQNTAKSRNSTR